MSRILGLDVSTSNVGIAVLDLNKDVDNVSHTHIVSLSHVEFKGKRGLTMWSKADWLREQLTERFLTLEFKDVTHVYIEAALKRFMPGMSSMTTIGSLLKFNGIASYLVHDIFKVDPEYISASEARKTCGLKMFPKAKAGGKNHKQQTFDSMMKTDLSHVVWPTKLRSTKIVDWSFDVTDAYVIAKAGHALNKKPSK
jgi:hypothetical protein